MDVLAVTIFISSCLAAIFVVCFALEVKRKGRGSIEHDSLLPLEDGEPVNKKELFEEE